MSSSHSRAAASIANSNSTHHTFRASKTVYLGNDKRALSIQSLAPVTAPGYMKETGFNILINMLKAHHVAHSSADLMAVMAAEIPISTTSATSEAATICNGMYDEAFKVQNLSPVSFFDDFGKKISASITFDPALRPANITFVNFTCKIEGKKLDKRIQPPDLVFNFSLHLPQTEMLVPSADGTNSPVQEMGQSSNDKDDNLLNTLLAKAKKQNSDISTELLNEACLNFLSQVSPVKKDQQSDGNNGFRTPVHSTQADDKEEIAMETLLSPKMKKLIQRDQSVSGSGSLQYSFYGSLGFVDNQDIFDNIFGIQPTILQITRLSHINSNLGADSISCTSPAINKLHEYIDKCHLDIFVSVCRDDYVGLSDPASTQQATQEICKNFSVLKQVSQQRGRRIVLHPAQLFDEFLTLIPSLPDNASAWSITLCHCFYDGLTLDLEEKMEDDDFILPDITTLVTKQDQLRALQIVKESALSSYLKLEAEKKRFTQMMSTNQSARQPISQHFTSGHDTPANTMPESIQQTIGAVHHINNTTI